MAADVVEVRERSFVQARSSWVSLSATDAFRISDWRSFSNGRRTGDLVVSLRSASTGEHTATVRQIARVPPFARELRRGVAVEVSGGATVAVRRNGVRPISRLRSIHVSGPGIEWQATGSWSGTRLVDVSTGARFFRSRFDAYRMWIPAQGERAVLLIALVAAQIPQSLSPFFWKNSL